MQTSYASKRNGEIDMFQEMMVSASGGGGGNLELIPATSYDTNAHSVTFNWNYDAEGFFVIYQWVSNSYQGFGFGEIATDNVLFGSPQDGLYFPEATSPTWTSVGFTKTATKRSLTLKHVSLNFKNAYIVPLYGTVSSS